MGIDKARFVTTLPVRNSFMNYISDQWQYGSCPTLYRVSAPNLDGKPLKRSDRVQVVTCREAEPSFYLLLNFKASRREDPRHVIEVNPNNMQGGLQQLFRLFDSIFDGFGPEVFKISRLDLNGDIELPVEQIFRSLYVPPKKKADTLFLADNEGRTRAQFKIRLTGFYIGASPAMLRVYDKREEMRVKKKDLSGVPDILTRVEFEFRHHKCPVKKLSEISKLANLEPFHELQFFSVSSQNMSTQRAARQASLEDLVRHVGMHQAIRSLNEDRHFKRDYQGILQPVPEIREQLQRAFLEGVKRFLKTE